MLSRQATIGRAVIDSVGQVLREFRQQLLLRHAHTVIHVEYMLREGGAVWGYRCRLEGQRVM